MGWRKSGDQIMRVLSVSGCCPKNTNNHPWFINKGSTCVTLSSGGGAVGGGQELAKAGGS